MDDRLADAGWLRSEPLAGVLRALNGDGIETRVVGGAVRNALMGTATPHDVDLATTAEPEVVAERAAAAGMKAVPTGIAHGTVTVIVEGRPFEVTTLRHDVETHGRHATVAFGADWEADARRRDFTMNALYADADGRLYDPVGGRGDIAARRVRFIGDPHARIREDYLRILRFFRFHAQYGSNLPDGDGLEAAVAARHAIRRLSGERIRQEMLRLLVAPGAAATLELMADRGILPIVLAGVSYWPSMTRLTEIENALGREPDAVIRLAVLAVAISEDGERLAGRLRLSNAERDRLVAAGQGWHGVSPRMPEVARKEMLYRAGETAWRDRVLLAWARSGAPVGDGGWHALADLPRCWQPPAFPLKGADLIRLGVPKGPEIGRLLAELEREWIAGDFSADREALLHRARRWIGSP